ncbi:MAG TPA: 2-C-methyl-D-erythritol 2,4-cyclodiphosphate synthase [Phycisphaerae bacterium]|nr:2-C-methyl-D-erythritol 2,4-cyclodiphosphate synthase [Phycisphaerae bacterium]
MAAPVRVGLGFDVHRLVKGRRLVIAGVEVPHTHGPQAHSDGDVVLHAVADAILGAAGRGDLGEHFPDTDPAWKDADSSRILERVLAMAAEAGWRVASADVNVFLEEPKLGDSKQAMRKRLAELLKLDTDAVGLKARTLEGLGPIGQGEAIAAQAAVVLERI